MQLKSTCLHRSSGFFKDWQTYLKKRKSEKLIYKGMLFKI